MNFFFHIYEVWSTLWTPKTLRQRDFAIFGGEYLEEIGLAGAQFTCFTGTKVQMLRLLLAD